MSCKLEPIRVMVLLTRAMMLFILVGVVTFEIPAKSESAGIRPTIHADVWGNLPLKMVIDSTQYRQIMPTLLSIPERSL